MSGEIRARFRVDRKDFADFIEKRYLKDYKPEPNEFSAKQIRDSLKDAHYFLRIDDTACDELFFMAGGDFTVSAGRLLEKQSSAEKVAYSVSFSRRDRDGKRFSERATVIAFRDKKRLVLEFPDRKLRFCPETGSPADLAAEHGKPAQTTGLAEY